MNVKKIVGVLLLVFVLFWLFSRPDSMAHWTNYWMANMHDAGDSMVSYISDVTGPGGHH